MNEDLPNDERSHDGIVEERGNNSGAHRCDQVDGEDRRGASSAAIRRQQDAPHTPFDIPADSSCSSLTTSLNNTSNPRSLKTSLRSEHGVVTTTRKRPFPLRLSVSLETSHARHHPWDDAYGHYAMRRHGDDEQDDDDNPHQNAYVTPDFQHWFLLTAALLLCTCMSVLSALDAEQHCLQHEMYAVLQLIDDDAALLAASETALYRETTKCIQMFQRVVLPTGGVTAVAALIVLGIIYRYNMRTPATLANDSETEDAVALPVVPPKQWGNVVRVTVSLFCLFVIMLGSQTYNVTAVMLQPRSDLSDEDNPYQSLAAVDRFGLVGDNANLYYLAWLSEGLALALVYQVATACFRVVRAARRQQADGLLKATKARYDPCAYVRKKNTAHGALLLRRVTTSLTSWDRDDGGGGWKDSHRRRRRLADQQSRAAWYSSLYRLRVRTGIWTAAGICCLIIVASAQYIWRQVLWPYIAYIMLQNHAGGGSDTSSFSYLSVCRTASKSSSSFSLQLCRRTLAAWCSGLVAAALCATAIAMHLVARYGHSESHRSAISAATKGDGGVRSNFCDHDVVQLLTSDSPGPKAVATWQNASPAALLNRYYSHHHPKRLPLRTELMLGVLLSILLGLNAVMVTGVQGPALKVGNLYYASWLSFLLCVRICLGCVEEICDIDEEEDDHDEYVANKSTNALASSDANLDKVGYEAPEQNAETKIPCRGGSVATPSDSSASNDDAPLSADSVAEKQEKKRLGRVRSYFFLSIFSTVCASSSYDAAVNQNKALSPDQKYMMLAPFVVAIISFLLFGLSLSKRCYATIANFWVGGLLSIVSFSLWLGDLLLTMHSDDSWAVDSIGEIAMANLYYFAWASIITSGVLMTSYVKALFGIRKLDSMSAVWVAICKVCFVILGASLHIWHTISDNCKFDEITLGAVTFCSRTILAITVSLTGLLVGGLVVLGRIIVIMCPLCKCTRMQAHIEMLISLFLVLLFAAAVALITGIGGPGQSVGDLYYSTWLALWVSLGIFVSCYRQLNDEEEVIEAPTKPVDDAMRFNATAAAGSALV